MSSPRDLNFIDSLIIEAEPKSLWHALEKGRLSSLWNDTPLFFENHQDYSQIRLDFNCQGLKTDLKGKCFVSDSKQAVSWKGRLLNGRDGFVDVEIFLAVDKIAQDKINSKKNQPKTKISMGIVVKQTGGRIALLDPRITKNFWKNLNKATRIKVEKKIQAISQKNKNVSRKKNFIISFRFFFLLLLIFVAILSFVA